MHFQVLSSGSQGNAYLVRAGENHVLVECGLAWEAMEERFQAARYQPRNLDHILLSHGHLDHTRSAGRLSKRTGATVHCAERLMHNRAVRKASRMHVLPIGGRTVLERPGSPGSNPSSSLGETDAIRVQTIRLPHDADPTVAFRLDHGSHSCGILTDMGQPKQEVARQLRGVQLLLLEFNYDPELLEQGPYSDALKRRIRSGRGHLSNAQSAEMLTGMLSDELHTVVLAHLSTKNNRPELALSAAQSALQAAGRDDVRVIVAEQEQIGPNLEV